MSLRNNTLFVFTLWIAFTADTDGGKAAVLPVPVKLVFVAGGLPVTLWMALGEGSPNSLLPCLEDEEAISM